VDFSQKIPSYKFFGQKGTFFNPSKHKSTPKCVSPYARNLAVVFVSRKPVVFLKNPENPIFTFITTIFIYNFNVLAVRFCLVFLLLLVPSSAAPFFCSCSFLLVLLVAYYTSSTSSVIMLKWVGRKRKQAVSRCAACARGKINACIQMPAYKSRWGGSAGFKSGLMKKRKIQQPSEFVNPWKSNGSLPKFAQELQSVAR